jgi:metallo-beta-lactamase family protein
MLKKIFSRISKKNQNQESNQQLNPESNASAGSDNASPFLRLKFCGGVGTTTGANFLLIGKRQNSSNNPAGEHTQQLQILVDCGLEQGERQNSEEFNRSSFPYDPKAIDFLLITHAHTDHIGRIPKLVHEGFAGVIYSTEETKKITAVMFEDALKLMLQESSRENKEPMYTQEDVSKAMSLWKTIRYHEHFELHPGYDLYLKDAGHVLGSTMYEITVEDKGGKNYDKSATGGGKPYKRKIVFTGDLGNSPSPLLRDTEDITDADYLLMESVYGDRNHEDRNIRTEKLADAIIDNHKRGGVLVMPVFALEKTQELLYEIHELMKAHKIPQTPVYLDAPMAIKLTQIYAQMSNNFNDHAKAESKHESILSFPGLRISQTAEDSKAIAHMPKPLIVMAGSGMSNGGRILHHELQFLGDPRNTILFTGYQAVGTIGRLIRDGASEVDIHGERLRVKAQMLSIDGYSSHKDSEHLVEFVDKTADTIRKVFVCMGETKSALFLVQRLRDYLGVNAVHPDAGEEVILD